jgi:hypothetical protein
VSNAMTAVSSNVEVSRWGKFAYNITYMIDQRRRRHGKVDNPWNNKGPVNIFLLIWLVELILQVCFRDSP